MYDGSPFFMRFGRYGSRISQMTGRTGGWLLMAPGLSLVLFGLAILIWPELLAYLIAGLLIFAGATIAAWGWRMAQMQKRVRRGRRNGTYFGDDIYSGPTGSQRRTF